MWRGPIAVLGVMLVSAATGCGAAVFECASAEDCVGGRAEGMCQANGFCSFADATCPSGQRYGDRAPSGVAGECVDPDADGSTSDPSVDTLASTTTTDGESMTSTSATSATTEPSTTATSATATSTTTDPSTTTDDPSMSTTDPATTSPMSDSMTDPTDDPVCGNGVIDENEECDGQDLGGLDCTSFEFGGGELVCDDCLVSTVNCTDCMMGCADTCSEPNDCPDADSCVVGAGAMVGTCWPNCMADADCDMMLMGAACFLLESGAACLYPCQGEDDCPQGLACTPLENMQLGCL